MIIKDSITIKAPAEQIFNNLVQRLTDPESYK